MLTLLIKEILIKHPKARDTFGDSFVYEPSNIEEEKLGFLYLLSEMTGASESSADGINQLASAIKKEFYSSSKRTSEAALEAALKKANLLIKDLSKEQQKTVLKNLNIFVAVFHNGTLYFSKIGKIHTVLFRYQEIVQDIDQTLEQNFTKSNRPAFKGIIRGEMEIGDRLIVANQDLLKLFSLGQLKSLSAVAGDEGLFSAIESQIKRVKEPYSVFALFMEISGESVNTSPYQSYATEKPEPLSLEEIVGSEYIAEVNQSLPKVVESGKTVPFPEMNFVNGKNGPRDKKFFRWKGLSFLRLPLISQLLLIFFLAFAFFVVGGAYLSYQKNKTENQKNFYRKIITEAQEKQHKADTALVYQDEREARLRLEEALQSLQGTDFLYFKEEAEFLAQDVNKRLNKINGLAELNDIQSIFDFGDIGLTFKATRIFGHGDNLFFLDAFSKDIYKYNLQERSSSGLVITPARDDERLLAGDWTKDRLIFYSSQNKLYFYDPSANAFTSYGVKLIKQDAAVRDLAFYKGIAYVLDGNNKEVIRYIPVNLDSNGGTLLFKNPSENLLKYPTSLSVAAASTFYFLESDGEIKKYRNGLWESVAVNTPALFKNPIKIRLGFKYSNLYVLDPAAKKIIILNKSGKIIRQYFSNQFAHLLDFWITDDEKIIYLLDDQRVYKIDN